MSQFIPKQAKTFKKNEKGVTMLEYALIAALIAVVSVTALTTLGNNVNIAFNTIAGKVSTANK
jgi:pilus assembly protein Flp/PilA